MTRIDVTTSANIALIKYWGKADAQANIPAVGSLSLTLAGLLTKTTVTVPGTGQYLLDGAPMNQAEAARIQNLARAFNLNPNSFNFSSHNYFPTAAGLASSASGGAAAALALAVASGGGIDTKILLSETLKASGSAPRSLLGGFARLDPNANGVSLRSLPMPPFWDLRVLIICTASGRKQHLSREAMEHSKTSPYYPAWLATHKDDLDKAETAILKGDFAQLMAIMEHSTMKMHALPLSSQPPVLYWNGVTLEVVRRIMALRDENGWPGGFTMDAGPHVKLFTFATHVEHWRAELKQIAGVNDILESACGAGPSISRDGQPLAWQL